MSDPVQVTGAIEDIKERGANTGFPPKLIVIDTLARCSVGSDENSAQEMGYVIDGLMRIREATGATVLVVRHSGKDTSRGMRGSNRLLGDLDTSIEVDRDQKSLSVTLNVLKQKDADEERGLHFTMQSVDLPLRAGHSPQSSLIPVPAQAPDEARPHLDACAIAEKIAVDTETSLSRVVEIMGWSRGKASYDRLLRAIPDGPGITVETAPGRWKIMRRAGSTKYGALIVEVVA